jgi:hypothetical protein
MLIIETQRLRQWYSVPVATPLSIVLHEDLHLVVELLKLLLPLLDLHLEVDNHFALLLVVGLSRLLRLLILLLRFFSSLPLLFKLTSQLYDLCLRHLFLCGDFVGKFRFALLHK